MLVHFHQVYSNTRVLTRVNTNQHEPDTNQHESDTSQHKSALTEINTSPTIIYKWQKSSLRVLFNICLTFASFSMVLLIKVLLIKKCVVSYGYGGFY